VILYRDTWQGPEGLIDVVRANHAGNPRSQPINFNTWGQCKEVQEFMRYAIGVVSLLPGWHGNLHAWVTITPPTSEPGNFEPGYPHDHLAHTVALIHWLDPGDNPAPLIVEDAIVEIPWEHGTIVLDGMDTHAFMKNRGSRSRVALLVLVEPAKKVIH